MSSRPLKVWIVDDDQSVRWVLEKALKQANMDTRSFERAEHLLEAIDANGDEASPDVLITDVRMPGMSGLALLERLRTSQPDLPIIVYYGPLGPGKRSGRLQGRCIRVFAETLRH